MDGPEVVELQDVAGRSSRASLGITIGTVVGVVAIVGLLLGGPGPTDPITSFTSPSPAAPTAAATATHEPSAPPSSAATQVPGTPAPLLTPNFPSWRWEPVAVTVLEDQEPTVTDVWFLPEVDLFVAAGSTFAFSREDRVLTPFLMASSDGREWSPVAMPTRDFRPEAGVVVRGSLWLIGYVGGDPNDFVDTPRQVWTTSTTFDWSRADGLDGLFQGAGAIRRVAWGPLGWIAAVRETVVDEFGGETSQGAIRLSRDGTHWTNPGDIRLPAEAEVVDIATDGSRWLMLVTEELDSGAMAVSTKRSVDGAVWIDQPLAQVQGAARDIAYGPAGFVIVGSRSGSEGSRPVAWTSPRGARWTEQEVATFGNLVPVEMTRVIATDRGYLAIADSNGQAWVSADGATWKNFEVFTNSAPRIDAVTVRGDHIVALADSSFNRYVALIGSLEGMHR